MSSESLPPTTILVVDDVPENLRLLTKELKQYGYEVRGVLNGAMALTVLRSTPIDLVLLDIRLPDMDGYAVCEALKANAETAEIPVLFISALDEPLDKVKAFAVGGVDYITKPFKIVEINARIKTQIKLLQAQKKLRQFNQNLEQQVQQRTAELAAANQTLRAEVQIRRQAEARLRDSEARYQLIADNMSDLVCLHQANGQFLYTSPSCQLLLGYSPEEMYGKTFLEFCHPEDLEHLQLSFQPPLSSHQSISSCYRIRCQSGYYIWLETLAKPLLDGSNQVTGIVTSSRDVTQRIEVEAQLRHDALHDSLTHLPNRNWLAQQLQLELVRCKRYGACQFGLLMLDLDQFKSVNDSLGHLVGDQLLIAVASLLQDCVRDVDVVSRIGGDEFVILLNHITDIQEAVQIAGRIQAALKIPFSIQEKVIRTSASIGILFNDNTYQNSDDILRDVDIALYQAKAAGRDRYEIFGSDMLQATLTRVNLENDLHNAIEQQCFETYYQPVYSLKTNQLIGFEALVRWRREQQLIMPSTFIDLAEETGLISYITHQIIDQVCRAIRQWKDQYSLTPGFRVAINISGQDFRDPDFIPTLDQALQNTGVSPEWLTLEITERILIEPSTNILRTMDEVQARGIHLSIDDFGTGYSSLKYLSHFPINTLKIDKSFVDDIQKDQLGIVRAVIALARNLGMDTIAEGVETERQRHQLCELDCKAAQGYLFSHPLPFAEASKLFQS